MVKDGVTEKRDAVQGWERGASSLISLPVSSYSPIFLHEAQELRKFSLNNGVEQEEDEEWKRGQMGQHKSLYQYGGSGIEKDGVRRHLGEKLTGMSSIDFHFDDCQLILVLLFGKWGFLGPCEIEMSVRPPGGGAKETTIYSPLKFRREVILESGNEWY